MVNKYLNVLEIVTPFDVGENGWAWKVISSAFEFYAHRKITSEKIDKLVIYILDTPPEKPLNKSPRHWVLCRYVLLLMVSISGG